MIGSQKMGHGFGLYARQDGSLAWTEGNLAVERLGVGECHMREMLSFL